MIPFLQIFHFATFPFCKASYWMQSLCTFSDFLYCLFISEGNPNTLIAPWPQSLPLLSSLRWLEFKLDLWACIALASNTLSPINVKSSLEIPHCEAWELASWVAAKGWKYGELPRYEVKLGQLEVKGRRHLSRKIPSPSALQWTTLKCDFFLQPFQTHLLLACHVSARPIVKCGQSSDTSHHIALHLSYLTSTVSSPSPSSACISQVKRPHVNPCLCFSSLEDPSQNHEQTRYWGSIYICSECITHA